MTRGWSQARGDSALNAVSGLGDPVRRRLYNFVAERAEPVSRDEAATATEIGRAAAGYHLDRLTDDGLLAVTFARRDGRSGPGAGRPAKLYEVSHLDVTVNLPARDDEFVGHLLATAVESDGSGRARDSLRQTTRRAGRELGQKLPPRPTEKRVVRLLNDRGYAPVAAADGIRLRNCPFHHLTDQHQDLVCQLNLDLLSGVVEDVDGWRAELDPQPDMCCVVLCRADRSR